MEWMMEWAMWAVGIGGVILVNILAWVFVYGKWMGGVNIRIKAIENKQSNPAILPECSEIFAEIMERLTEVSTKVETTIEIRDKLSEVYGKVEAILIIMRENQRNNEKKHLRKKVKDAEG